MVTIPAESPVYPPASRGRIVIWGYLGSYPFGGMTWQVLHYLVGLRRLGFDVWYVEDTDAEVRDPETLWGNDDFLPNVRYLEAQMASVGMPDRWVFRPPGRTGDCFGALDIRGLSTLYRDAEAVINLCGSHELRPEHDHISCLIYLETDPVPKQIALARGDATTMATLSRYQHLFTYAENLGKIDCRLPAQPLEWKSTRPPVCTEWWHASQPPREGAALTTITSWQHSWNDIEWQGETWRWSKHHEFLKIRSLPKRAGIPLELSITGIGDDDADELRRNGWQLRPGSDVADPDSYRDYIRGSLGEFTVAKEQYVAPSTGWFSDRSVCYLAAGRPVVTQETGFSNYLPVGEGLLSFLTEDDAADALADLAGRYDRHSIVAGEIAREYFGAAGVLTKMMSDCGLM